MREDSENRYCENCGADLLGKKIPEEHLHYFNGPFHLKGEKPYKDMDLENQYSFFEEEVSRGRYRNEPWFNTHFDRRIGIYDIRS